MLSAVPSSGLLDYRHDDLVLNHRVDVNRVVHAAEYAALIRISHIQVVEELEPERFQLVSVVLEQVEVVSNC